MSTALPVLAVGLMLPAVLARATVLAPTPLGALFYYANVFGDTAWKRAGMRRGVTELVLFGLGLLGLALADLAWLVPPATLLLALLELVVQRRHGWILNAIYGHQDKRRSACKVDQRKPEHRGALPSPSVHPDLLVNLGGPFVARTPRYDLGDLSLGRQLRIEVIVGNHSRMPCQVPVGIESVLPEGLEVVEPLPTEIPPLGPGEVTRHALVLRAVSLAGNGRLVLTLRHADETYSETVNVRSVFDAVEHRLADATIARFPNASRSAFSWRGDMDLYDCTSHQSIDGLAETLGLAARYRFPQTLYLSTRLSLDADEAKRFQQHFGVDRGHGQVEAFVAWLRENVTLAHVLTYPTPKERPFALELGNHMHLHYGTDAAAAAGNGWQLAAGLGAGRYSWHDGHGGSLAEQRDNALAARRIMEEALDFTPKSWAMPDSTNDRHTPAAVEAAGCEVTSDADASHWQNVISQPPPHHPQGTGVVELTKRYPGDPQDYVHYAMFLYWLHRGHRLAVPVIYMAHHHLRLYEGLACARFTEAVMRYVLSRFHGDFYIATVYAIGIYWREVLSPSRRRVSVAVEDGRILVKNEGDASLSGVPVDLRFAGGRVQTLLVDLVPGSERRLDAGGGE